jgi:hypothetical protein
MEALEGMLSGMKLSAAERKGIQVEVDDGGRVGSAEPMAVEKVLAEKLVHVDGLANALGKIGCSIKGVACKDLGENHFLFTFHQAAGKRRALEEGPWMFGRDLVVMADFDPTKMMDEMEFAFVPMWVHVLKLPFGMMKKTTGEAIGKEIGIFMAVEADDDSLARSDSILGGY